MKRKIVVVALAGAFAALSAPAFADPNFGPGNSGSQGGKAPSEQKCHPPGQTAGDPGCK
jgi:hypothetical protein